jgi:hypothetical protein
VSRNRSFWGTDWVRKLLYTDCSRWNCLQGRLGNGLAVDDLLVRLSLSSRCVPGSSREVLLLDLWRSGASTVLVDGLLGLGGGLLGVVSGSVHGVSGMLVGKTLDLLGLLVRNVVALLKLSIDDVLVLDVDEGSEIGDEGRDQAQAPERDELDEEVGDEGREESL